MDLPTRIEIQRELARRSLLDFTRYTYPAYHAGWFHAEVAMKLDAFLDDVDAGRSPRLMLFAPPRHGKSELVSRRFPAFALGRNPDLSIIATSYSGDLSSRNNRDVQRVMDDSVYQEIFPTTRLYSSHVRSSSQGSYLRNSDVFEVVGRRGVYRSAGVCGGITGMGGQILIIDDPVKDALEAESSTYRERVWEWYRSTFYTRLAPGGGLLLIMTRWHEDDLAGRLLSAEKSGGDKWNVVKFPAVAEGDELHRKAGEPLHAERYPLSALKSIKTAVGSRVWSSLYQQRPTAADGAIFKRDLWRYYRAPSTDPAEIVRLLGITRVIQSWDTAFKAKEGNDYNAGLTFGEAKSGYYLLDCVKRQMEYPELKSVAQSYAAKWCPHSVLVEDTAAGQSLIQELKRDTRLPIVPISVDRDKVSRAHAVTPLLEAGRFMLPEGEAWTSDFVDSLASFPNGLHDDDVDAFTQGANYLVRGGGGLGLWEFYREQAEAAKAKRAGEPVPAQA